MGLYKFCKLIILNELSKLLYSHFTTSLRLNLSIIAKHLYSKEDKKKILKQKTLCSLEKISTMYTDFFWLFWIEQKYIFIGQGFHQKGNGITNRMVGHSLQFSLVKTLMNNFLALLNLQETQIRTTERTNLGGSVYFVFECRDSWPTGKVLKSSHSYRVEIISLLTHLLSEP